MTVFSVIIDSFMEDAHCGTGGCLTISDIGKGFSEWH